MYLYVRCIHLYPSRLDHKFRRIWLKSPQSSRAEINSLSYKSQNFNGNVIPWELRCWLPVPIESILDLRAENTMPLLEGSWEEPSNTILLWLSVLTSIILKSTTEILQVVQNLTGQKINLYQLSQNKKCTSVVRGEILYLWIPLREEMSLSSLRLVGRVVTPNNK